MKVLKWNPQPSRVFGLLLLSTWLDSVEPFRRAPTTPRSTNDVVYPQKAQKKFPLPKEPSVSLDDLLSIRNSRRAEETTDSTFAGCDMCVGLHGSGILPDAPIPSQWSLPRAPNRTDEANCTEWNDLILEAVPSDSYDCLILAYNLGPQCCDRSNMTASYVCEANLKEELLGDGSGYASTATPVPAGENGLDVNVTLTFYHVTSIDTVEGTAEMFFSIDLYWFDERLAWDPAEHDGCLTMQVRATLDPETTEIFVPDLNLQNRIDGVHNLPDEMATVVADGSVQWKRNGGLKAICAFTGLEPIPFDSLGCYFQFGSQPGRRINYHLFGGDPGTPGLFYGYFPSSYQEFKLSPEKTETRINEDTALIFQFYFDRAHHYYITKIVVPTILFTFLSFGTFMLDQRVGERLGFGVSLLLVMVAQSIVTADMLPISEEALWIDSFALWSYYWVIVAVFESVIVAYLYYQDSEEERIQEEEQERIIDEQEQRIEQASRNGYVLRRTASNDVVGMVSSTGVEVNVHPGQNGTDDVYNSDDTNPEDDTPQNPRRGELKRSSSTIRPKSVFAVLRGTETGSKRWRLELIRKLDRWSFIILPSTYLLFIIIMLATAHSW